jgi:RNA polymerase sigma-70 factor (ECF subfamily)
MPQDPRSDVLMLFPSRARRRNAAFQTAFQTATDDPDLPLVRAIAEGSGEALGQLYDRHSPLTLGLLRRMLGNPNEAEEVLQEVFLQVWRDARRYDPERATPRGWLLLIARSRALDRLRSTTSRQRRENELMRSEGERAIAPLGTRRLEQHERQRRIGSALELLPREQRQVIELAFYEGLTQTQMAARLGAPLGTVKSRVLLAMRKLREILADEADGEAPTAKAG